MAVVRLHQLVALLGHFPALAGVDLEVEAGEVVLLQGPNGAGKTTLLRVCAGLVAPTDGTAEVLGHDLHTDRSAVRRRVALVGHAGGLYGDLTVDENLRFWARTVGASEGEATAALDRLAVAPRLHDVTVDRLSTGQRKRTALAAAVVRRPELWLLDEPHAGLDQDGRDIVDELVGDAADAGATVLVASHELERVGRLDPRVVTVAGGTIREPGHAP